MGTFALINLVLSVMENGPQLVAKLTEIGRQTGELTDEQTQALRARQAALVASDPAWKPSEVP